MSRHNAILASQDGGVLPGGMPNMLTQSVKWMVITMIAPEVVVGMAFYDYLSARKITTDMGKFTQIDGVAWTSTHSYFANMGGFVIQSTIIRDSHTERSVKFTYGRTYKNANQDLLAPMMFTDQGEVLHHNPHHLSGRQIWQLRRKGIIPRLPDFGAAELEDRSKSDTLVKLIALFQIFWAVVHITIRAARKLPISHLEITVIAFSACAVIIYMIH